MAPFLTLLVLLAPGLALAAEAQVVLWPAVGTPSQVVLTGRVLAAAPTAGSSTLSRNLRRLTAPALKGVPVEVRFGQVAASTVSGDDGLFEAVVQAGEAGFPTGLQRAEAKIAGASPASAVVQVLAPDAPFFVVSDLDDTLSVTHVRSKRGLVRAALLEDELTQPAVPGMSGLYRCLAKAGPQPPAFALVSGSPLQYAGRVAAFLASHRFPPFGLYLRELKASTLHDYKQPLIRALMKVIPQQVVLIGDSGEHDPEVYAQMDREFPGRVKAIYIRDAGGDTSAKRLGKAQLFHEPEEVLADATAKALAPAGCVLEREEGN